MGTGIVDWAKTVQKKEESKDDQGSKKWLDWRTKGLGSSDAPVLMGDSPWKNLSELWEEKRGLREGFKGNWATERGKRLEPEARELYERVYQAKYNPEVAEHSEHKILRASFDGINHELKRVLEIKCPGMKDHLEALSGKVPKKYFAQVQWLMLVSGYSSLHYMSYLEDGSYAVVHVDEDKEYQAKLIEKALWFWDKVQTGEPVEDVTTSVEGLESLMSDYAALSKTIDELDQARDEIKEKLKELIPFKCDVYGYRAQWIERKGSVDYSKIPELQGVDLEPYRKASSKVFEIRKIK